MFRSSVLFIFFASPLLAEDFICSGTAPDWHLTITGNNAIFDFERKNSFQIPDTAYAQGREWPRAKPLIGDFDTAVVLLDKSSCETGSISVDILTQRGQTPILLTTTHLVQSLRLPVGTALARTNSVITMSFQK